VFISNSRHFKLRKALESGLVDANDANYEAWDSLSEEDQDLIDKADRADDDWSTAELEIEWDRDAGNRGQVGLVVHTGVHRSSIEEAEDDTSSELYQALQRYGRKWAEKELEMMQERIQERIEELQQDTLLAEREAEAYVFTEILDYTLKDAAEEMETSTDNIAQKRHRFKNKIEKSERTAEL